MHAMPSKACLWEGSSCHWSSLRQLLFRVFCAPLGVASKVCDYTNEEISDFSTSPIQVSGFPSTASQSRRHNSFSRRAAWLNGYELTHLRGRGKYDGAFAPRPQGIITAETSGVSYPRENAAPQLMLCLVVMAVASCLCCFFDAFKRRDTHAHMGEFCRTYLLEGNNLYDRT